MFENMKSLNQSFLSINPELENILKTKFLPGPEIFTSIPLEACFDYFHRKDPLVNYTKLKENDLFIINPLIENKIINKDVSPNVVKYNRFVDVLQIFDKNRFKANNNGTINTVNKPEPENATNLGIEVEDNSNNREIQNLGNDSNIKSNAKEFNSNPNPVEGSNNIDINSNFNPDEKTKTIKKKVPYLKILEENVNLNASQENGKGMLVQLRVGDDIINGIILENNKIQCAFKGCEKIFKNKYKLNDHLVTHSKNKKYTCSIDNCNREFKRRQTLNRHIRSFHQRITRHQCKYCSIVFSNYNSLLYHERKFHTNYLPYRCLFRDCDKAFPIKSSLVSHVRQFHKIEPEKENCE